MPAALNSLPVRVEMPVLAEDFSELRRSIGSARVKPAPRVPLLVVALYAVQRGVAAREIDPVERHPDTGLERVEDMCLNGVDWRLSENIAAERSRCCR